MNAAINNNSAIEYGEDAISKFIELIEKESCKLKTFAKSKTKLNLNFFNELNLEFDEIISQLEDLNLWEERKYFLAIEDMVLYIVHENSIDKNFGHCDFAAGLLDFFISLFKTNQEFYKNSTSINDEEFRIHQESCRNEYHEYRCIFYQKIYESSGTYTDDELYEILKGWR